MLDLKYGDRIAESTISTGTGDISLAGAIDTDHATFGSQFADGDLVPVSVFGGGKWMTLIGRYNSGANSLTRITFRRSSTGSNLSLSGTMTVMCGWGADDAAAIPPPQCGRLVYVSATAVKFSPCNGNQIKVNGVLRSIPNAGITGVANTGVFVNGIAAQNLAANTFYYVYVFISSGVVTADFRTDGNGHLPSDTVGNEGVEVRVSTGTTKDDSRTLIGMVATNASSQFQATCVCSWFNRRDKVGTASLTGSSVALSGFAEVSTSLRVPFLLWADEAARLDFAGVAFSANVVNTGLAIGISIDGASDPAAMNGFQAETTGQPLTAVPIGISKSGLIEAAAHYATILGGVSSTSGAPALYVGAIYAGVPSNPALTVLFKG
jgi:hypothetical protein